MQDKHSVAAFVHRFDNSCAQALPIGRCHVGAVDQRQQFAKTPVGKGQLRLRRELFAHSLFEPGRRGQAAGARLHTNGTAGVEHHDVLGCLRFFGVHCPFSL
ncbi:hypothetical protein D3C86_1702490 [compost metagenome]